MLMTEILTNTGLRHEFVPLTNIALLKAQIITHKSHTDVENELKILLREKRKFSLDCLPIELITTKILESHFNDE